ncbi:MAG: fibronectin type III domain-containing protein, partial [Verrucomicrobiota bacterium]
MTTPASADVTARTATLGGNVTSDGGATVTARGVVLAPTATNGSPQIGGTGVVQFSSAGTTGVFTVSASGLYGGTSYSYAAYATNLWGTSYSPTGTFTTGTSTADAPTAVVPVSGSGQAVVSFTAPANSGGLAISGYTVTATPAGGGATVSASGSTSPITVTGLANGTSYTFTATATNAAGTGAGSAASAAVTPGQSWAQDLANGNVTAVANDAAGNVYVTGSFSTSTLKLGGTTLTRLGTLDAFVAKFTSAGTLTWAKNFGGSGTAAGCAAMAVDASGNVHLCGTFKSANLTTPALTLIGSQATGFALKLDSTGSVTWSYKFGSANSLNPKGIALDASNNVYLVGGFNPSWTTPWTTPSLTQFGTYTGYALKLTSAGSLTWAKSFGGSGASARVDRVDVDAAGNAYLSGTFSSANLTTPALTNIGRQDAMAIKLDSTGAVVWARNYGGSSAYVSSGLVGSALDASGNLWVCCDVSGGNLTTPALTMIGTQDALVIKLDSAGTTTWARNYGGSGTTATFTAMAVDAAGNAHLGGNFTGGNLANPALTKIGTQDALAVQLDSAGIVIWAKNYGGSGATAAFHTASLDAAANLWLGGSLSGANLTSPPLTKSGTDDALLFKLEAPFADPAVPSVTTPASADVTARTATL